MKVRATFDEENLKTEQMRGSTQTTVELQSLCLNLNRPTQQTQYAAGFGEFDSFYPQFLCFALLHTEKTLTL